MTKDPAGITSIVGQLRHSLNEPPVFGMDEEIFVLLVAQPLLTSATAARIKTYFDFMMPPPVEAEDT